MVLDRARLSFSASNVATYADCPARLSHQLRRYPEGLLPTDRIAADVGSAVHGALMIFHRRAEHWPEAPCLSDEAARVRLDRLIDGELGRRGLRRGMPPVDERLDALDAGIGRAGRLILDDLPEWVVDGVPGDRLVWVEKGLDHGPGVEAVELSAAVVVRTRPDVVGVRRAVGGRPRAVVRDFKTRSEPVRPAIDVGTLVRGIWVMAELREPRCRHFVLGRSTRFDSDAVDLEVVNLMHAGSDDFLLRATVTAEQLRGERERLGDLAGEIDQAMARTHPDEMASPGGLCRDWCPFLNRCAPGRDHVRRYFGEDELQARLAA